MKKQNREFLIVSLAFLMTVIAWIVVDIYHIQKNQKFTLDYQKSMTMEIKAIDNLKIFQELEKRKK